MKIMYTEIHITDEQCADLKKWEKENDADAEELVQKLLIKFIDSLKD
jgi:hypothetical protein